VKSPGSTWELHLILASLSLVEGGRIPGVAVKCVEIWRNTGLKLDNIKQRRLTKKLNDSIIRIERGLAKKVARSLKKEKEDS